MRYFFERKTGKCPRIISIEIIIPASPCRDRAVSTDRASTIICKADRTDRAQDVPRLTDRAREDQENSRKMMHRYRQQ